MHTYIDEVNTYYDNKDNVHSTVALAVACERRAGACEDSYVS